MSMKPGVLAIWFLLGFVLVSCGHKKEPTRPMSAEATTAVREQEYDRDVSSIYRRLVTADELSRYAEPAAIERLFEQLKSPNQDPNSHRKDWTDGYPAGFDFKAQLRVHEAERILKALGTKAYPYLINHAEDSAYCQSDWYADLLSFTVGDVCLQIIKRQIELAGKGYKANRRGVDGAVHDYPDYLTSRLRLPADPEEMGRKERMQRWWNGQKDRPLKEIQIEALEYLIRNEETIGFPGGDLQRHRYIGRALKRLEELKA